jgi:hypothetical protein
MKYRRFKEAPVQPTIDEIAEYTATQKRVSKTDNIAELSSILIS